MRLPLALIFILQCLMGGCGPTSGDRAKSTVTTPEMVRAGQLERTSTFDSLVGRGVIEFHWKDDRGLHKDQGDLDFWKKGSSISLRISKFGDPLMWFGGAHRSYWMFDMTEDVTTLTLDADNSMFTDIDVALVLLGLTPLPEGEMEVKDGVVTLTDEVGRTWTAWFEPSTNRPFEFQVVDEGHLTTAMHHEGIRVELDGKHELHWPMTGGLIDLEDDRGETKIKIVFSSLSTIVANEPLDRVFSLSFLQKALKPTVIIEKEQE